MLKQEIKFTDYNDTEREETFYFNVSKAELARWTSTKGESFQDALRKSMHDRSGEDILRIMDEIIKLSYGKKTDSGAFVKTESVWEDFRYGGAYDELYLQVLSDPEKALSFITGILPEEVRTSMAKDFDGEITPEKLAEATKTA